MLTRKHFKELAEIVAKNELQRKQRLVGTNLATDIAAFCARHNPDFDRARFEKYVDELVAKAQEG